MGCDTRSCACCFVLVCLLIIAPFGLPSFYLLYFGVPGLVGRNTGGTGLLSRVTRQEPLVTYGICNGAVAFTSLHGQHIRAEIEVPCGVLGGLAEKRIELCYNRLDPHNVAFDDRSAISPIPGCSSTGYDAALRQVIAAIVLLSVMVVLLLASCVCCCVAGRSARKVKEAELATAEDTELVSLPKTV